MAFNLAKQTALLAAQLTGESLQASTHGVLAIDKTGFREGVVAVTDKAVCFFNKPTFGSASYDRLPLADVEGWDEGLVRTGDSSGDIRTLVVASHSGPVWTIIPKLGFESLVMLSEHMTRHHLPRERPE